jgi:lysine 2,3-aminomutase
MPRTRSSRTAWHGRGDAVGELIRERLLDVLRPTPEDWADWKWHFRHRITSASALARIVPMEADVVRRLEAVTVKFPMSITPYYLALVRDGDPDDPILLQSMPDVREAELADVGADDPLDEAADSPVPGLVHRYPDRALLVVTDICPLLCRHCTRKREWESGNWVRRPSEIATAVAYIRATPAIRDVIISGGDPLTLDNGRLADILGQLRAIPHVEIIRFGTRFPVVLPQRIDAEFCRICDRYGPIWLNTHFNHPNEITPEAERAVRDLLRAGVPVNNQAVLLRGINDTVDIQKRLSHALLRIRVRPYYLYHADEVRGTEHLRTPVERGLEILAGLRGHTSGLGVPTFVIDVPGGGGKIPLQPNYVVSWTDDALLVRNYEGLTFTYRNPSDGAARKPAAPAIRPDASARLERRRQRSDAAPTPP